MRIGLNTTDPQLISAEQAKKSSATAPELNAAPVGDKATLVDDKVSLSSLATQALNQPDVRQGLVDSLRQSVASGEYKLDPSAIAGAILGE